MNELTNQSVDRVKEAAFLERDLAQQALNNRESELAWMHLKKALDRLDLSEEIPECDEMLPSITLEFSNLCFALGKGFASCSPYLKRARPVVERLGDRRSAALISMHLARFYYFAQRREEALALFSEGKKEVEALGDEDILNRSAEFLGFYFHIQGLFTDALPHFEQAARSYEAGGKGAVINPSGPLWLAYCHFYLGHIHQAIGTLDYYRRLALERSDRSLATTLRAVMGMVLLQINEKEKAIHHLTTAIHEAEKTHNDLAYYFAMGNLSYLRLYEGYPYESWELLTKAQEFARKSGIIRQYNSPYVLEHLFELKQLGLDPVGLNFEEEIERQMQEPNIHLRGTAHRLRAMDGVRKGMAPDLVKAELKTSEEFLQRSGDPIQLAKTRLELARLKLAEDDPHRARYYAKKAWHGFSGYGDLYFPDDLRHLLTVTDHDSSDSEIHEQLLEKFVAMIQELAPSADLEVLLARAVAATNRFFGAERGGLFWFRNKKKDFIFRGGTNLNKKEVSSEAFKSNLDLIFKAYQKNQPQVVRVEQGGYWPHKVRAILCIPFEVEGDPRGVLYHDNSYVKDCFDFLKKPMLSRLGNSMSNYIERIYDFSRRLKESAAEKMQIDNGHPGLFNIVTQSALMKELLIQADRVARSDGTVLIFGETGVGKELLARRIHRMSSRNQGPFVTVDLTTIPDNLVDSELFGHEKGAFTGADRRKAGRLEIAHGGTVFIDEIGEIHKSIQVKLLRVLQEKTLIRLGASQVITSDFRLVVATNRDLVAEVAAGRFREDLYYRLNVVPLTLPPLRDRLEDVPLLSRHFLAKYSAKYNRPLLDLPPEDEARLTSYHWPGNVRELQNIIERAVILSKGEELELQLPMEKRTSAQQFFSDHPSLDELQRRYINYALEKTEGKVGGPDGAAEFLGLKRTTLQKRMKKFGIR